MLEISEPRYIVILYAAVQQREGSGARQRPDPMRIDMSHEVLWAHHMGFECDRSKTFRLRSYDHVGSRSRWCPLSTLASLRSGHDP